MSSFIDRVSYLITNTDIKVSAVLIFIYSILSVLYNQFIRSGELKSEEPSKLDFGKFIRKSQDFQWLYGLYVNSEELGDHFKFLLRDREKLLLGDSKIAKKYKFKSEVEIIEAFELVDIVNSKYLNKDSKLIKSMRKQDSNMAHVWEDWDDSMNNVLKSTQSLMKSKGLDTTNIDSFINEEGIGGELKKSKDVKALVSFLNKIMNSSSKVKSKKEVS
jgi:hypothetical protein